MRGIHDVIEAGAALTVPAETAVAGGLPIAFGDCAGFLHPGTSRRGVLMVASLGYEAHCVSQTWRTLAGGLAARGLPVLRFDYPGAFDSLGDHDTPGLVDRWTASIGAAAHALVAARSVDEIVVVAFGFGAGLALRALPSIHGATALVLLAPVLSGREQARELAITAKIADEYLGVSEVQPEGALSVAGFRFSAETLTAMKAVKAPARIDGITRVLVFDKPGRTTAEVLAPLLPADAAVETRPFEAYATLTFDPTAARPPRDVIAAVADFAAAGLAAVPVDRPVPVPYGVLSDGVVVEEGIRFGAAAGLFGVLTLPAGVRADRAVVLLNTGRSRHSGWARAAVDQARALAAAGIATFRIDTRAIGDSLAVSDAEVLYDESAVADVSAALDVLADRGFASAVVCGGCSGAFLAFAAGAADPRVAGLVLVNPQRLVWHDGEDLATLIREGTRTVKGQASQALSLRQWRRLLTGELAVGRIARAVARQVGSHVAAALVRRGLPAGPMARVRAEIVRRLAAIDARGAPVAFVYGDDDRGRDVLVQHFGRDHRGLAPFSHVTVRVVTGTDHNMTPLAARAVVTGEILRLSGRPPDAAAATGAVNVAEAPAMLRDGPAAA